MSGWRKRLSPTTPPADATSADASAAETTSVSDAAAPAEEGTNADLKEAQAPRPLRKGGGGFNFHFRQWFHAGAAPLFRRRPVEQLGHLRRASLGRAVQGRLPLKKETIGKSAPTQCRLRENISSSLKREEK
ncbi:unnamed protein product [Sphagnum tenellum]